MKKFLTFFTVSTVTLSLCGCSNGGEEITHQSSMISSSELDKADEFASALYSQLQQSAILYSEEFEVSAFTTLGESVHVTLKDYDQICLAEAIRLSTEYIEENASSYDLTAPKLTVISGSSDGDFASWETEDYQTGFWFDTTSVNVSGNFPLATLQGTYIPGSTDDMVVYIDSGGFMKIYHSKSNCPELEKDIKMWEELKKQSYMPWGTAKSSISEKYDPCEICIGG